MSDQDYSHRTWLSQLKDHLNSERYATGTARRVVGVAGHFLAYLDRQRVDVRWARPADVEGYLQQALQSYQGRHGHLPGYVGWQASHTSDIRILLRLVQGQWPPDPVAVTPVEILRRDICKQYTEWMTSMRGLAGATVSGRCDEACRFLDWMGERTKQGALTVLTVPELDAYMKDRAASLRRASLKTVANNIRCFLHWLHISGQTAHDLSVAVVAPSLYALEGIPSALRSEDIEKVLAATRQDRTPKGLRDYAILMLLSKYGLRAGEVTALRLEDMDWRKDVIRIRHTKTCAVTNLPIVPEVGEATPQPEVSYLEDEEIVAILAQPDLSKIEGQRDHVLLAVLYNTGARIQEALNLSPQALRLESPFHVRLFGKGRKERLCPLWPETVELLKAFLKKQPRDENESIFLNRYRRPLKAAGVRFKLKQYVSAAAKKAPSLTNKRVSPHTFRHAAASSLVTAGVDVTVIRSWLGHVSLDTTNRYARANLETKRRALEKVDATARPSKPPRWKREVELLRWLDSL